MKSPNGMQISLRSVLAAVPLLILDEKFSRSESTVRNKMFHFNELRLDARYGFVCERSQYAQKFVYFSDFRTEIS